MPSERHPGPQDCVSAVSSVFERVFAQLTVWRSAIETTTGLHPGAVLHPGQLDRVVYPLVGPTLGSTGSLLIGAGFIGAPTSHSGPGLRFSWWLGPLESNPLFGSTTEPTRLDLSTRGYAEYLGDFRSLEWYTAPEATRRRHVTGPYVDHLCTCDYILTLSMPTEVDGEMTGIVGADIYVKRLELELLPIFLRLGAPASLLNRTGRVIISTDPRRPAGSIVSDPAESSLLPCLGTPFNVLVQGPRNSPQNKHLVL
ncbi:cache domain-containing protein [Saxibacter everestensis]|uniref:Cache domain-containing protein n=1 Tax=Saxibacter everestensis TaxID=2909229 RepID=A0ABY8QT85_9MICO|nr:cache domain-containing protein [Brevibacteriaceae bacterium ZFBP1038]